MSAPSTRMILECTAYMLAVVALVYALNLAGTAPP